MILVNLMLRVKTFFKLESIPDVGWGSV